MMHPNFGNWFWLWMAFNTSPKAYARLKRIVAFLERPRPPRYVPPFLRPPKDDLVLTEMMVPPEDRLAREFERTKAAAAADPDCRPAPSRLAQLEEKG